jgi:hypothetical protein
MLYAPRVVELSRSVCSAAAYAVCSRCMIVRTMTPRRRDVELLQDSLGLEKCLDPERAELLPERPSA